MATTFPIHPSADIAESRVVCTVQATLRYMLGALGIIVGVDKFTNLIADWEQYLNPLALRIVPVSPATFMHAVGVVEMITGVVVLVRPRIGGLIMMAWLIAIALQLVVGGRFLDVAARDLVMAFGAALTLARLTPYTAEIYHPRLKERTF